MVWKVPLFRLNFDKEEQEAVAEVLRSGWLTMGERTKEFETRFADFLGGGVQAIAVSSATAALHMSLLALGVQNGDEVIVSALTFIAGANVVRMVGATPVLADCVSTDNWNIDPADVERKITERTKAVLIVHYAGYPCAMEELKDICGRWRVALIEDSAHAIGATYGGRQCGTFGSTGCFSFFANKNLSVGEGGMFVSGDPQMLQKGRYLRSHGMSTLSLDRHEGRAVSYDVLMPGLNYRMDEIRASLGLVQLGRLPHSNECREKLAARYGRQLASIPGISIPFRSIGAMRPCYHIYPILLDKGVDRLAVIQGLKDRGVQSSIHYPAIQGFHAYAAMGLTPTPIANDISSRELTLPLYPTMEARDVDYVAQALAEALT